MKRYITETTENLRVKLIRAGIIMVREKHETPFTLASGKKSRLFIDIKKASLNYEILKDLIDEINHKIMKGEIPEFDKIGGIATGGIVISTALSIRLNMYQIIVRSTKFDLESPMEEHNHGTKNNIIGSVRGKMILLVEDVATTGRSIVRAVDNIRDSGGECRHCVAILNREEGADIACNNAGVQLHSLVTKKELCEELARHLSTTPER